MAYEQFASHLARHRGQGKPALVGGRPQRLFLRRDVHLGPPANLVVFPASTEHVEAVLKLANENRIPVTPRGGTNVSGGSVPVRGGIAW